MLLQCSCGLECPELKSKLPDYLALLLFQGLTVAFTFGVSTAQVDEDMHEYAKTIKGEKRHTAAHQSWTFPLTSGSW